MKRIVLILLLLLGIAAPAIAQNFVQLWSHDAAAPISSTNPLPVSAGSVAIASTTSKNVSITGSAQTVSLAAASTKITLWTSSDAPNTYVSFDGTAASSSNAIIYPGASLSVTVAATDSIKILGTSGAGKINVVAD